MKLGGRLLTFLVELSDSKVHLRHNESLRTGKVSRSFTDIRKPGGYSRNGVNNLSNEKDRQFGVPINM